MSVSSFLCSFWNFVCIFFRIGMKTLLICCALTCLVCCSGLMRRERKLITNFRTCRLKPLIMSRIEDSRCRIAGKLPVVYGCIGYCRSSTISLSDRLAFVPVCNCCQPTMHANVNATLICRHGNSERRIPIITATRCYCRKCMWCEVLFLVLWRRVHGTWLNSLSIRAVQPSRFADRMLSRIGRGDHINTINLVSLVRSPYVC